MFAASAPHVGHRRPQQLAECPFRPVARPDMEHLPFRDGAFRRATHMWCRYHLDPTVAVAEASRVLAPALADPVDVPLPLTKRRCIVWATKA